MHTLWSPIGSRSVGLLHPQLISKECWPPRSPDLSPPDFIFMEVFVEHRVFK